MKEEVEHSFVFLYTMINGVSHTMGGLLYFISILRTKSEKIKSKNDTNDDDYKIIKERRSTGIKSIIIPPHNKKMKVLLLNILLIAPVSCLS